MAVGPASAATFGAFAWGANERGQLGNGTTTSSDLPVAVSTLTGDVKAISAGYRHSLALLSNGTVVEWGEGSSTPVAVPGLSGVIAISAGGFHNLALLSSGTVMAWGDGEFGQLGDGSFENSGPPVAVSGLTGVRAISAGYDHSLALLANGTVRAWGHNDVGQLGNGTTTGSATPVSVSELTGVRAVPLNVTCEPGRKPVPLIVSGVSAPPAVAVAGLIFVTTGTGAGAVVTVNVTGAEVVLWLLPL